MQSSGPDQDISEYVQTSPEDAEVPKVQLALQPSFYRIPRRFGSIPVDELPKGCDRDKQYYGLYPRITLPFQRIERVSFGHPKLEPNRLFWGDNLHIMRMIASDSLDLIYIDPPFFSGKEYNVIFGDQNEIRSFSDIWEGGMESYLIWLNARLLEMKRLLKETGTIFVHCDWHASHYIKNEMDKIFGYDNFRNEIIWKRTHAHSGANKMGPVHDTILFYSKSDEYTWHPKPVEYSETYVNNFFKFKDEKDRPYRLTLLTGSGTRNGYSGKPWKGIDPTKIGRHWAIPGYIRPILGDKPLPTVQDALDRLDAIGRVFWPKKAGGMPLFKQYKDDLEGVDLQDLWVDIPPIPPKSPERIGYPTQKPEALLIRIIEATTDEKEMVGDFFCGGGTTPVVAQKLNRRWIAVDSSKIAVSITEDRILGSLTPAEHEEVQQKLLGTPDISLEYWGIYEIPTLLALTEDEFRRFILAAYNARVSSGEQEIHGYRNGIPIMVGKASMEHRITKKEVIEFARYISTRKGKHHGVILAWAFAPSATEAAEKLALQTSTTIDFVKVSLVPIESNSFKDWVVSKHKEYASFLTFVLPPEIRLRVSRVSALTYEFDLSESVSLNANGKIANVQWDFEYKERFVSTKGFSFIRGENNAPVLKVRYSFPYEGRRTIACKVQDDLGGEKLEIRPLEVR